MTAQFLMVLITILIWGTIVVIDAYARVRRLQRNEPLKPAKLSKRKTKRVREAAFDELYFRCKELADHGEVTYFSVDDIWNIKEELKYKK